MKTYLSEEIRKGKPKEKGDNRLVRCKCRRIVASDMLVYVGNLPTSIRGDAEYLCDGCISILERKDKLTQEQIAISHGVTDIESLRRLRQYDESTRKQRFTIK